jgi:glucose-6-phosphate 1-epimerase
MRSDTGMVDSLPTGVSWTVDPGGRRALRLEGAGGQATIALCGAQVLSWHTRQGDVLWTASKPEHAAGKPVRGGIPVVFPWFGDHRTDAKLPAHGFARTLHWRLEQAGPGPRIALITNDDERTRAWWPHAFRLQLEVTLGTELGLALTVHNPGPQAWSFEAALHTYFGVGDVAQASVHGLERVPCTETATAPEVGWDPAAPLRFRAETDRVFHGAPDRIELRAPSLRRAVVLHSRAARSAIVWNPWPAKTARLSQMAADDWTRFCCIETANVRQHAIELAPGASHTMAVRFECRPL